MNENSVFTTYPKEFVSRSKFFRKMQTYTAGIKIGSIVASADPNGFALDFAEAAGVPFNLDPLAEDLCTHCIIFCIDEISEDAINKLRTRKIPAKVIKLQLATVVNKDRGDAFDVYIGRGTIWGNPYPIGRAGDREEVLRMYRYDFERRLLRFFEDEESNVAKIRGKKLGCHCKPANCHGDILAAYVNSLDDGQ